MAGCEWRCRCRCRAGMTGCLLRAGIVRGRVMGCPGRGLMLPRGVVRVRRVRGWARWRVLRGWVILGSGGLGGMGRGVRWCGRMR
jgi:hypothetical protein